MSRKPVSWQWFLLVLLVFSIAINYIDRTNLSLAATDISRELNLTKSDLGLLLGAFFWTYAVFQLVAGWLVQRFNVYLAYGLAFALWSAATALTGFAGSLASLFALRLALGVGEAIAYPAYSRIIACDFEFRHRGLANSAIDAGAKTGPALGTLIGGLIVAWFGWRPLFYILGFGAMVWLIPWFILTARAKSAVAAAPAQDRGPGFLEIASHREFWGTAIGLFSGNYIWYFTLTWLPPYLEMERHFSKTMMATYGSIPYWGNAVASIAFGVLSDRFINRGQTPPARIRKRFVASGLLSALLILVSNVIPHQAAAMALLTAGCLAYGMFSSNCWALTQTLAGPTAAGKWTGMQNAFGNLAGVAAPWLTGFLAEATGRFLAAFTAVAAFGVVGAVCCYVLIRDTPPEWRPYRGTLG